MRAACYHLLEASLQKESDVMCDVFARYIIQRMLLAMEAELLAEEA